MTGGDGSLKRFWWIGALGIEVASFLCQFECFVKYEQNVSKTNKKDITLRLSSE